MSTSSSAVSASAIRPGPTSRPASRSTRPNVTSWRTSASASSFKAFGLLKQADQRLVLHELEVLVVLEHRPERRLHQLGVELRLTERCQGLCPVDRLGDPRRLVQVQAAQALHVRDCLRSEALGYARDAEAHDLQLPLARGMPNPVKQTSALERVVKLPRAVRGE